MRILLISLIVVAIVAIHSLLIEAITPTTVSFDGRSFFVNNERKLFIAGSVHYPRASRAEWPQIFQLAKENGLNLIQTYVFWDVHEPANNQWYFPNDPTSSYDLAAFIEEAGKQGLYVHLRISGYVCAEWNFGKFLH
jgi:beta-galactosidase GanA